MGSAGTPAVSPRPPRSSHAKPRSRKGSERRCAADDCRFGIGATLLSVLNDTSLHIIRKPGKRDRLRSSFRRAPVIAVAGAQSFGGRVAARPPPGCTPYLERDTSTTLRIKAAKAHIAPTATHISANVIRRPPSRRTPTGHHDSRRRRSGVCEAKKLPQLQILDMQNSYLAGGVRVTPSNMGDVTV